jgi:hypothetical protein
MTRVTEISKEQLAPIVTARTKTIELAQAAEQAIKDARMAELEFKVQIQQLYLEKGLDSNCRVDINTGAVTWPDVAIQAVAVAVEEDVKSEEVKPRKKAKKKDTVVVDEDETTV